MEGKLYICPTPIGNLEDITLRTLKTLREVDLIAAEDTRHTIRLLNHFKISKPLISCHEYNEMERKNELIDKIFSGTNVALVSDAGMPGISDPGHILIKEAIKCGIQPIVLPGPSAFTVALVGSGLRTDKFRFIGFLDRNSKLRIEELKSYRTCEDTLIFYESPHRILKMLKDLKGVFGNRKIVLARELTKKFEEFIRTDIEGAIDTLGQREIKGEFVVVLEGLNEFNKKFVVEEEVFDYSSLSDREYVEKLINEGKNKKDAIKLVSKERKKSKNEVYQQVLDF